MRCGFFVMDEIEIDVPCVIPPEQIFRRQPKEGVEMRITAAVSADGKMVTPGIFLGGKRRSHEWFGTGDSVPLEALLAGVSVPAVALACMSEDHEREEMITGICRHILLQFGWVGVEEKGEEIALQYVFDNPLGVSFGYEVRLPKKEAKKYFIIPKRPEHEP